MASGNVPPQRSDIIDGNCFYRANALWRDEMSDENSKYEEIRRLSFPLIEKNPKVFQPLLFSSNSVKEHVKKNNITDTASVTYLHLLDVTEKLVYF